MPWLCCCLVRTLEDGFVGCVHLAKRVSFECCVRHRGEVYGKIQSCRWQPQTMWDIFWKFAFTWKMNLFFESNFGNLQGHGLSALAPAVASENPVSLISLGCCGRARPNWSGLTAKPLSAGHTVHTPCPSPWRSSPDCVICGPWLCRLPRLPSSVCLFLGLTLGSTRSSKWSSPSGALPDICITSAKGAHHLGLCQGLWGRTFLQGHPPSPHCSLLCLPVFVHHSGNGNEKGSTQPD